VGGEAVSGLMAQCTLLPNFNNTVGLVVGPGNGMRVSHVAVIGPKKAYRGNLNPNGVGIGNAAALGGAHGTTIDHTYVGNFYMLHQSSVNGGCCLSDQNRCDSISGGKHIRDY
jgi:hypothetical protein